MRRQERVKPLNSSVFMGLPWPMNSAGIRDMTVSSPGTGCIDTADMIVELAHEYPQDRFG